MTPYEIRVLLHYYSRVDDHEDLHRQPPIWQPTIVDFMANNLLALRHVEGAVYCLTDRGKAYVDALQQVPMPESSWRIDWPR